LCKACSLPGKFVGAGSPTIPDKKQQSHKPALPHQQYNCTMNLLSNVHIMAGMGRVYKYYGWELRIVGEPAPTGFWDIFL